MINGVTTPLTDKTEKQEILFAVKTTIFSHR